MNFKYLIAFTFLTLSISINAETALADDFTKNETISLGDELNDALSSNIESDNTQISLNNNITLSNSLLEFIGNVSLDGSTSKHTINGNSNSGLSVYKGSTANFSNTIFKNFTGTFGGAAINNVGGNIDNITNVDFINNTSNKGALANVNNGSDTGTIGAINALFSGNQSASMGSAIYNTGIINTLGGAFENNKINTSYNGTMYGGAVYNAYNIDNITANFSGNLIVNTSQGASGGALANVSYNGNTSTINQISGNFTGNKVSGISGQVSGGAIDNASAIGTISGTFENNSATNSGTKAYGGAINNSKNIASINNATFITNRVEGKDSSNGGAINNSAMNATIGEIRNTSFENNSALSHNGDSMGGAIFNSALSSTNAKINNIINSNFTGNHTKTESASNLAQGGAIASNNNLTITADAGSSLFSGNYVEDAIGNKTANAIYMASTGKTLDLVVQNGGLIQFDDEIDGKKVYSSSYDINISGNNTGNVIFNNAVKNAANINLGNGTTLTLGSHTNNEGTTTSGSIDGANLNLQNGTLNLENGEIQNINIKNLTSTENAGIKFDANLNNGDSDQIKAESVTAGSKIKLEKMNILEDGNHDIVLFANQLAPEFSNLDSFAAFNGSNRYTFESNTAGVLSVVDADASSGLNSAVTDTTQTKSYTVADANNVSGDLGALQGGDYAELSILGNNKVLDGESHAGLTTTENQQVNIDEVAELKGFNSTNGGFINNAGKLNVQNTVFKENDATGKGGAVYNSNHSEFHNTTFQENGNQLIEGGALYNTGTSNLYSTLFSDNKGQIGGAIYNTGTLILAKENEITNKFTNNTAVQAGGAIFNLGNLTINDTTFSSNRSYQGAAIDNESTLVINNSEISFNTSTQSGGAILNNSNATIDNTKFANNTSTHSDGAAIYNSGTLIVSNSSFEQNTAGDGASDPGVIGGGNGDGGAISSNSSKVNALTISNSSFLGNTANSGGAIWTNSTTTIDRAVNAPAGTDYVFSANTAYVDGGAIYSTGKLNIKGINFNDNMANGSGGAIYSTGTANVANAIFNHNGVYEDPFDGDTLSLNGGAIYNSGTLNLTNVSFTDNKSQNGGAIWSTGEVNITVDNGTSAFSGNQSNGVSNAIYMADASADLNLNIKNGGLISFDDDIDGDAGYEINISGDGKGSAAGGAADSGVKINANVTNAGNINVQNTNLALGTGANLAGASLNLDNALLNLKNGDNQTIELASLNANNNSSIAFDADLGTGDSDTINATATGNISLDAVNITNDGTSDIKLFADGSTINFDNLDSFKAYTEDYSYTFSGNKGTLSVAEQKVSEGIHSAVEGTEATRSFTVGEGGTIRRDLGAIGGGDGVKLTVVGNDKVLDGRTADGTDGFGGMEVADKQILNVQSVASVEGFHSTDGGFVKNSGELNISNTSFKSNQADTNGGAIWSEADVNISADGEHEVEFTGNTANGTSNAIYMADNTAGLNLNAADKSTITINDGINGVDGYNINTSGNGKIIFNETVKNAGTITVNGADVYLGKDELINDSSVTLNGGALHLDNQSILADTSLKNLTGGNGVMHLDADTFQGAMDNLKIENLYGTVKIIAHNFASTPPIITFAATSTPAGEVDGIKFAEVTGINDGSFNILRVDGSAYSWEARSDAQDDGTTDWLMFMRGAAGANSIVTAETIAYMGLNSAGFEQTRGMIRNLEQKTASNLIYLNCCGGYYDRAYNSRPLFNVWASPVYRSAKVDSPFKFDADIGGLDAGADTQLDPFNRVGVFASYRKGKYDFSGKSDDYYSDVSSDINIDSYLAGLYYRYTNRHFWSMASIFGGIQQADIKTDDGIKADTDGTEYGASLSAGYAIPISSDSIIEPKIRISHTQVSYDNIKDDFGKEAKFDDASMSELEAGVKFEKSYEINRGYAKIYFEPSVIQTIVSGDNVRITGLDSVHTMDNQTLGRAEVGFSADLDYSWSAFGSAAYTYGSDYRDTSINLGLNYAF